MRHPWKNLDGGPVPAHSRFFPHILLLCFLFPIAAASSPREEGGSIAPGGGGHWLKDGTISFSGFSALANETVSDLPAIFRFLAITISPIEGYRGGDLAARLPEVRRKLFPAAGNGAIALLPHIAYHLREHGLCLAPDGRAVDASAWTEPATGERHVCLSYAGARHLTRADARSALAAMLVHEVSHLLGASETEAVALQRLVAEKISPRSHAHYLELRRELKLALRDARNDVAELRAECARGGMGAAAGLRPALSQVFDLLLRERYLGMATLSLREHARLATLASQSLSLEFLAREPGDPLRARAYTPLFGGRAQVPAPEFLAARAGTCPPALELADSSDLIVKIEFGDTAAAHAQLAAMDRLLAALEASL